MSTPALQDMLEISPIYPAFAEHYHSSCESRPDLKAFAAALTQILCQEGKPYRPTRQILTEDTLRIEGDRFRVYVHYTAKDCRGQNIWVGIQSWPIVADRKTTPNLNVLTNVCERLLPRRTEP